MSNHVHIEAVAGRDSLSSWIRRVHSRFADTMNRAHDRIGSMFVRGPKAFVVPPGKVGRVLAYIHNNPVRAGVVQRPADSDWTSHRAYIGATPRPGWLHVDQGLERAGLTKLTFDEWVQSSRASAVQQSDQEAFEALELEEAVEPDARPTVDVDNLVHVVANVVGVSADEMRSRRRQAGHVLARHVLAHSGDRLGLSGAAVARAIGASQQSISKILTQTGVRGSEKEIVDAVLQLVGSRNAS